MVSCTRARTRSEKLRNSGRIRVSTRGTQCKAVEPRKTEAMEVELVKCPICWERLTRPITTPCGHTFCAGCLYRWFSETRVELCPVCRRDARKKSLLRQVWLVSFVAGIVVSQSFFGSLSDSVANVTGWAA